MHTRSVDVAAYLLLNGIRPKSTIMDGRYRVREFRYEKTEEVRRLMRLYDEGALVPAKAFAEARAQVKVFKVSQGVGHKRGALDHVKAQLGLS